MDKPHFEQMDNGLLSELQQQNEFLQKELACPEAARARLEEAGKEMQEKEQALRACDQRRGPAPHPAAQRRRPA